jgi:chorismate-pyruvate lyase
MTPACRTRLATLLVFACVAHPAAQDAPLALVQRLNADILGSRSATLSLEHWCRDRRLAATPRITAHVIAGIVHTPSPEQRQRLQVGDGDDVKYRRVELQCGDRILSEADNWYVPGRLTADMNRLLETTDTPFGTAVQPLGPSRETFAVTMLWSGEPPIPDALFEHRALLYTRDHQPFSEVHEVYLRQILASEDR